MKCKKCDAIMLATNSTLVEYRIKYTCKCGFIMIVDRGKDG